MAYDEHPRVIEAYLPNFYEIEKIPIRLKQYPKWWWINGQGFKYNYVAGVYPSGETDVTGNYVTHISDCVRPMLHVEAHPLFPPNSTFVFGGAVFEMLTYTLAFCVCDIGECPFRTTDVETANPKTLSDYEQSDVKQYIDRWLEKASK